jgi:hypothetical protein
MAPTSQRDWPFRREIVSRKPVSIHPVAGDLWTNRFFPGPKLFQGIRAIATDADWSAGDGLDVTGPIEALVLILAGRFAAVDQLQGDGTATLRMRADALRAQ